VASKAADYRALPGYGSVLNRYFITALLIVLFIMVSACSTGGQASMLTSTPVAHAGEAGDANSDSALSPGVTDFRLPDAISGGDVSLSETLETQHVVLIFYRAFW
jgi:hypothetical protein